MAGFQVPENTVCLIGEATKVGKDEPMSYEKLCPVLGVYRVADFKSGARLASELANFGGIGHRYLYKNLRFQHSYHVVVPLFILIRLIN